ncbi:DNA damage-inducible transcript 4-like protein [Artemia franciscana]|uniref:Uncharacterized protein n=1 Tax=Artemia franciscana TaxID=6661 RepID=A0AA88I906_ARTSF|nr:hypothetical protein QYM36_002605 [Artemia franciscana]
MVYEQVENSYTFQDSFDGSVEEEEKLFLKDQILQDLFESSHKKQPNTELLVPDRTVERISSSIWDVSQTEPCGLKGCIIYINVKKLSDYRKQKLVRISFDRYTVATFEVHITLKVDTNHWLKYVPEFLMNWTNSKNALFVQEEYELQIKKLFR